MARLVVTYDPEDDLAIQEFISTADSVYMSDLEAIAVPTQTTCLTTRRVMRMWAG